MSWNYIFYIFFYLLGTALGDHNSIVVVKAVASNMCLHWSVFPGDCFVLENLDFQRQVICALNAVLYDQLQYKGNERDYYNPLNSYIHQVSYHTVS